MATAEGVSRARKVRRLEQQNRWDKEAINNVIGSESSGESLMESGPRHKIAPLPHHPYCSRELELQRERNHKGRYRSLRNYCRMPRSGKRAQAHCDPCRVRIEDLKMTPEGAERLDRRCEVLNEALAQKKLRGTSQEGRKLGVQQKNWQANQPMPSRRHSLRARLFFFVESLTHTSELRFAKES